MGLRARTYALDDRDARQRWERLWAQSPQRSVYTSIAYADCVSAAYGLRARIFLAGTASAEEAGAIILSRGIFRQATPPPFTQYFGPVLGGPSDAQTVHSRQSPLELTLGALEAEYRHLLLLTMLDDPRPAQWRKWKVSPLFTYLLQPASGPAAWSAGTRRTFNKFQNVCQFREDSDAASQIIQCCKQSYSRHGRKLPAPEDRLTQTVERLQEQGMVRLFTVRRAGRLEAGLAVLHDGQTAHYWIAGSTPGPAMTVLVGRTLEELDASGITTFDFVGANTPSIAEFKRRFGGHLSQYYSLEYGRKLRPSR